MKKILALLLCLMLPLSAAFADEHADAPLLEVHQMPIGYADTVTPKYNAAICDALGITPLEGYEPIG